MDGATMAAEAARGEWRAPKPKLTDREVETLQLVAGGLRTAQIAHALGIQAVTVDMHLRNAREKLNAATREQAVAIAIARNVVDPSQALLRRSI